eukprot:s103_g57.t1
MLCLEAFEGSLRYLGRLGGFEGKKSYRYDEERKKAEEKKREKEEKSKRTRREEEEKKKREEEEEKKKRRREEEEKKRRRRQEEEKRFFNAFAESVTPGPVGGFFRLTQSGVCNSVLRRTWQVVAATIPCRDSSKG